MNRRVEGKSYARGGPKSKRKKTEAPGGGLLQTKITQLESPIKDVARSVVSRVRDGARDRGHRQAELDLVQDKHTANEADVDELTLLPSEGMPDLIAKHAEYAKQLKHTPIIPNSTKRSPAKEKLRQSKLTLSSGPASKAYLLADSSEEEQFRATQLERKTVQRPAVGTTKSTPITVIALETDSESTVPPEKRPTPRSSRKTSKCLVPIVRSSSESSDEDLITPNKRRKRFMPLPKESSEDEDDDTKITRVERPTRSDPRHDRTALDLDNKPIKITSDHRQSSNRRQNAFRDHLDRLKRKKQGLPTDSESEDEDEDEGGDRNGVVEEDAALEDNDDFIDHDESMDGNDPDAIPEDFRQPRSPLDQFKIAVQWEILDLLMPQGGLEPDSYFLSAITWLRNRTQDKGQAALSSIWRRAYVRALMRGPDVQALETGNLGFFCDACGRTNRVATYVVKFEGPRYDHLTLEDLDSDADSSEDDLHIDQDAASDVEVERARQERIMRQEWNLGVNCYERTSIAHELFHLRKHLRIEVYDKLEHMGFFSAAKKYARSIMPQGERMELANQITEQLDEARFPQRLWSRYKSTIERGERYIVDPSSGSKGRGRYGF